MKILKYKGQNENNDSEGAGVSNHIYETLQKM